MNKKLVLYDSQACIKCMACAIGCSTENRVRLQRDKKYNIEKSVTEKLPHLNNITPCYSEKGSFPNVKAITTLKHCNHCSNPQCANICPTKAITTMDSSAVIINEDLCIGANLALMPAHTLYLSSLMKQAELINAHYTTTD